jgi:hypothetical protein
MDYLELNGWLTLTTATHCASRRSTPVSRLVAAYQFFAAFRAFS